MDTKRFMLYVGSYAYQDPSSPGSTRNGIYVYAFDPADGQLTYCCEVNDIDNPSFLAVDSQHQTLYAVDENQVWEACLVHAYRIDPVTGYLQALNRQLSQGVSPCFIMVDQTDRFAAVANYGSGNVALLPTDKDGHLLPASDVHQHNGSGPNVERQEGPHAHCAVFDPANRFLFVVDLGIDKVMSYRLDAAGKRLIANQSPYLELPAGCGPRHLTFHPDGRFAYVINELNSTVTVLSYDANHGAFNIFQTVSTLPEGYQGQSFCAEILITPSGKFLFGSNRGHDSLAIFAIDEKTGWLTAVAHQATYGKTPRHFTIDPTGAFLLVANQDSNNIVTFRIDQFSGRLELTQEISAVPRPVCLRMIRLD